MPPESKKKKAKNQDVKIELDRISEDIKKVATKIDNDEETDDLEMELLRKACTKQFGTAYESMSKEERLDAFYILLKKYLYLNTIREEESNEKQNTTGR